jgi:hypothetical protein
MMALAASLPRLSSASTHGVRDWHFKKSSIAWVKIPKKEGRVAPHSPTTEPSLGCGSAAYWD